jgi:hypothetical protein
MSLDGGVLTLSDRGDGYEREEPGEHGYYESTHDLLLQIPRGDCRTARGREFVATASRRGA